MLKKILIVEDSELLHRTYDLVLRRYKTAGAEIYHAFHGVQALQILERHSDTSLILLDIEMPVMNGIQFLQHRKKQKLYQDIPVIVVTSIYKQEDIARCMQAGANAHLSKPFEAKDLYSVIEQVVRKPELAEVANS